MDPMIIGRTIMKKASTVGIYETYWQPREGNSGTFSFEIMESEFGGNLTLTVQTKTLEQPDSGATDRGNVSGTIGVLSVHVSNCKGVVRCKVTTPNSAGVKAEFIRVLQPQWEYN